VARADGATAAPAVLGARGRGEGAAGGAGAGCLCTVMGGVGRIHFKAVYTYAAYTSFNRSYSKNTAKIGLPHTDPANPTRGVCGVTPALWLVLWHQCGVAARRGRVRHGEARVSSCSRCTGGVACWLRRCL